MSNPTIEYAEAPSVADFFECYVRTGTPVILSGLVADWPALERWSVDYLVHKFGKEDVSVKVYPDTGVADMPAYLASEKRKMTLGQYVDETTGPNADDKLFLMQQTLFRKARADLGRLPYIPRVATRMAGIRTTFWMGPPGITSPLHQDFVNNFVVQLQGAKRWAIFPPDQLDLLYLPSKLSENHFSPVNFEDPDTEKYPKFAEATPMEFDLRPGEVLYLPPRWPHYVRGLDYTVMVNDWWVTWPEAWAMTRYRISRKLRLRR